MPCSRNKVLARLFYTLTSTAKFIFLFFYLFSLFVAKLLSSLIFSGDDEYEEDMLYDDDHHEEDEEEEVDQNVQEGENNDEEEVYRYFQVERDHLVADIMNGGDGLVFESENIDDVHIFEQNLGHSHSDSYESVFVETVEAFDVAEPTFSVQSSFSSEINHDDNDAVVNSQEFLNREHKSRTDDQAFPVYSESKKPETNIETNHVEVHNDGRKTQEIVEEEKHFTKDEKFLIFEPPKSEAKKLKVLEKENDDDMFGDSYTVGSTSKSSSEWRSSIRDSGTDNDPFSSSSRRSCPKWESYTVYQKYDEEMMFLDKISAQKLHETESLRSFLEEPRSISQRIVHKLANNNQRRSSERTYKNTYHELESAYIAQICLTWEALNWNYANFQRKRATSTRSDKEKDLGCPAHVAQQFQQFQVLLQRYIETEPYERGRRPEIYARMRSVAPKLLQVPEYQDYEEEQNEEVVNTRITSAEFLVILEDAIRTFMNFLRADRESHCQVLATLFKRRRKGSLDPALIEVVKKNYKKRRLKLKELQRPRNCLRKRKLQKEEEMDILMSLIDLKVVSRVLRMADITQEQLQWCEGKMGKIRLWEGKLQRDSSPLFFPSH